MIKGIFYKEWLKTKWLLVIAFLITAGAVFVWYQTVYKDYTNQQAIQFIFLIGSKQKLFIAPLKFFPPLFALLLSLFQFFPEITNNRYRLTMLLPVKEDKLMLWMNAYGYLALLIYDVVMALLYFVFSLKFMSFQLAAYSLNNMLSWFIAGALVYGWLTSILFEPGWKNRIFYAVSAISSIYLSMSDTSLGMMEHINTYLFIVCLFVLLLPYYTSYRLRKGLA